jgi:hypothetical protein
MRTIPILKRTVFLGAAGVFAGGLVFLILSRDNPPGSVAPDAREENGAIPANVISATAKTGHAAPSDITRSDQGAVRPKAPETHVTQSDKAKLVVLNEILSSKNDNDPRLDREFNALTDGSKALMRSRYAAFGAEKRNERGTIVFLLGRNLAAESDTAFLTDVLREAPCFSLENCAREAAGSVSSGDLHHDVGTEVTLAYPQIVALKSIERYIFGTSRDPAVEAGCLRALRAATASPVRKVAELAREIQDRYERR